MPPATTASSSTSSGGSKIQSGGGLILHSNTEVGAIANYITAAVSGTPIDKAKNKSIKNGSGTKNNLMITSLQ